MGSSQKTSEMVQMSIKIRPLPQVTAEGIRLVLSAMEQIDNKDVYVITTPMENVCGMLVGASMEMFGLENPSISDFTSKAEEYLQLMEPSTN